MTESIYDVIVIGAGPGGMTAALYTARSNLKTLLLERGAPGGQMINTADVENFSGFPSITGPDLAANMYEQVMKFDVEYGFGDVKDVVDYGDYKEVHTGDQVYKTRTVIIATGSEHRRLGVPGEKELNGRGVSYCAVCDGAFFRNKEVCVIGGGNSALEEANYLTQMVEKVNIIIRRDVFRADEIVQEQVKNNPKINIITKHVPVKVIDDGTRVTGLVIRNVDTNEETTIATNGIFPYIGLDPSTSFLEGLPILDERGYMIVDENCETAIKGIYGAGDVIVKKLRQVVTATSDGAIAAQHAFHQIKGI